MSPDTRVKTTGTSIPFCLTLAAGLAGALVLDAAGLPAPFLSGSMIGVIFLLVAGIKTAFPEPIRDGAMLISGAASGCSVTPEMLASISRYPLSLVFLFVTVTLIILVSRLWLIHVAKWDEATATFASIPGALSMVLGVASTTSADMPKVIMVQSFRSLVIVVLLPSFVTLAGHAPELVARPLATIPVLVLTLCFSFAVALLFRRLNVAAPFIFGAMLASASLHATGLVVGNLPGWMNGVGFVLLGAYFGTRFIGITKAVLRETLLHTIASFIVTMGLASIAAVIVIRFIGISEGEALVAFAPGGLEAMMALALALGLDPLYVGAHHFARFLGLSFLLPALAPRYADKKTGL